MMKAMLLAAGYGKRLMPLTKSIPKPMLKIGKESLIEHHIIMLVEAGFTEVVINISHLRQMFLDYLGDGSRHGIHIIWSDEGSEPLNTGSGILNALPLLGESPSLIISADIYTDWKAQVLDLPDDCLAHIVMVNNPQHHPQGDYFLDDGSISMDGKNKLTYAGIGVFKHSLFTSYKKNDTTHFKLADALAIAIAERKVLGTHYTGFWADAGNLQNIQALQERFG